MSEVVRLLIMLGLAGAALTVLGSVAIYYMDEERRVRRGLRNVLGAVPEAVAIARGRGRGAAFSFRSGLLAVAWDSGAWCLVYRIDELVGAELLVNGTVLARAFRGEPRRALDQVVEVAERVTLRLVFDDAKHPDFDLDLWMTGDDSRRAKASPAKAVQEANRWMARAEAILRRPLAPQAESPPASPPAQPAFGAPADDAAPDEIEDDGIDLDEALDEEAEEDWNDLPRRLH